MFIKFDCSSWLRVASSFLDSYRGRPCDVVVLVPLNWPSAAALRSALMSEGAGCVAPASSASVCSPPAQLRRPTSSCYSQMIWVSGIWAVTDTRPPWLPTWTDWLREDSASRISTVPAPSAARPGTVHTAGCMKPAWPPYKLRVDQQTVKCMSLRKCAWMQINK